MSKDAEKRTKTSAPADTRKTIAIVISNFEFGGAQQQIVELANNLDPNEFIVHVISLDSFVPLAANLKIPSDRFHIVQKDWKYDFSVAFRLASLLRKIGANIIHGFLFDAEIAARLAGRLAGVEINIGSERNCDYSRKKIQLMVYWLTRALQSKCIANSNAGARFNSRLLSYPIEHYIVVHNGVNTERFRPGSGTDVRSRHDIPQQAKVIGVFGSFKAQKNHKLFFRAARVLADRNQDIRFLLVGDELHGGLHGSDVYKESVDALVDELKIRHLCVFAGNQENVEEYYRACDLTVLPSLHEGMPNVVLESLASAVPVVATNVADNALLIPDGEVGFLVPSDDLDQLVHRTSRLIDDTQLREKMSDRALTWVKEHFSAQHMAQKMGQAYASLL